MKTFAIITTTCLLMFNSLIYNMDTPGSDVSSPNMQGDLNTGISQNNQQFSVKGTVVNATTAKALSGVLVSVKNHSMTTFTDSLGKYELKVPNGKCTLIFDLKDFTRQEVAVHERNQLNVSLAPLKRVAERKDLKAKEIEVMEERSYDVQNTSVTEVMGNVSISKLKVMPRRHKRANNQAHFAMAMSDDGFVHNTEEYDVINENIFKTSLSEPLSTFSIDVDAASYSNIRRTLNSGQRPPKDIVRIEEMINYFHYDYPEPDGEDPFSITTEVSKAPWNDQHQLVHIGLQGKKLDYNDLQPCNLVFLIDVSGSMNSTNKLPLLKSSMKMLVNQLDHKDRVALVVYAGSAGLVLPSTPASQKDKIIAALDRLTAGGSTAGGAGIKLAYKVAKENLIRNGNNRVILATDGDFNVGASSTSDMVRLIEEKRKDGIFLTITGFGMGNYKDSRMEQISNAGNGNYYYIDNIQEAEKVFVTEMRATLFTIAKDVKIQVEFNPNVVQAYRLIGYENRALNNEDFNDDKKDAGELGAGHTVTAIYEIIPVGIKSAFIKDIDPLKYQANAKPETMQGSTNEILTVKFRYKQPDGDKSKLIEQVLANKVEELSETSNNFRFSAAVAEFGMLLRDSEFKGNATYHDVLSLADKAIGQDEHGYRREFIKLVKSGKLLAQR